MKMISTKRGSTPGVTKRQRFLLARAATRTKQRNAAFASFVERMKVKMEKNGGSL